MTNQNINNLSQRANWLANLRSLAIVVVPAFLLLAIVFFVAFQFVKPAPPNHLAMSTGAVDGTYHALALRYQKALKKQGILLELKTSGGAVENLARLLDKKTDVDVGFVQGGLSTAQTGQIAQSKASAKDGLETNVGDSPLVSLGGLYYEPIWIFYRAKQPLDKLVQLGGMRIAIGKDGSGTRKLALELLNVAAIDAKSATLLDIGGVEAAVALENKSADAVFLIGAPESAAVQQLLNMQNTAANIRLMSLSQAAGTVRRFPFLSVITLPQGAIDFAKNIPERDVTTLAATANLVARDATHPALMYVLLDAAAEVHKGSSLFNEAGVFPNAKNQEFPLGEEAERYFKSGKPFLQRYLPYWLANFVDRMLVLLIPIFAVLIPVVKLLPDVYTYRIKAKANKWYGRLRDVETEIGNAPVSADVPRHMEALDKIEAEINAAVVPTWFSNEIYGLRAAIDMVRERLGQPAGKALPALRV